MVKETKENFTYTAEVVTKSEMICDICGCVISEKILLENSRWEKKTDKKQYWALDTGHYDWGNDSCDSLKSFDLCSAECVRVKLDEYFRATDGRLTTAYFELQHVNL